MTPMVDVRQVKVGMFVHLDLSWMSHPFPRSSFLVENAEQVRIIQGLGLKQVRWDPARSQQSAATPPVGHADAIAAQIAATPAPVIAQPAPAALPADDEVAVDDREAPPAGSGGPAQPRSAQTEAAEERRRALAQQREAALLCETQYQEAGQVWRDAFEQVRTDPQAARRDTESLSRAMLDKMLVEGEMCIRVLNAASGDRATAHAMNVAVIAMLMGRMLGLQGDDLAALGTGALLHDVGKLDLPERLRHADDQFSAAERRLYASHVDQGLQHARRMGLAGIARDIIGQHHEQADGGGFPMALRGDAIALAAHIVGLVNRFDNLCNPPVLSRALTPHEALSTMFAHHRGRYDPTVLSTFIRMMGVYPAGSVVQLTDERYALVVSVNAVRPLKPRVLVHDGAVPRDEALHLDLDKMPDLGIRRSIRAAQLPAAARDYLAPKPRVAYFFEPGAAPPPRATEQAA